MTAQTARAASGDIIVVDCNGGGDYTTIYDAVGAATGGETIFIKNGEYSESITITLKKSLSIVGESQDGVRITGAKSLFSATETTELTLSFTNLTILNAGNKTNSAFNFRSLAHNVTITNCTFDNCSSKYGTMQLGHPGTATIDGCTFLHSKETAANGAGVIYVSGAGTYTIKNTIIDDVHVQFTPTSGYMFGAIYVNNANATLNIENTTITNVNNFDNEQNVTPVPAKAVIYNDGGTVNITGSKIQGNTLSNTTNNIIYNKGTVKIEQTVISDNTCANEVFYNYGSSPEPELTVNYCNIHDNTALGIVNDQGSIDLEANYWGSNELPDGIDAYTWIVENNGEYTLNNGDPLEKEIPVIPYINAEGNTANCTVFTAINGRETTLGEDGETTWYVVKNSNTDENVNNGVDAKYTGTLTLNGNVNLILCDGAEMSVTCSADGIVNNGSLTIYGQSTGDGQLTVSSTNGSGISGGTVILAGGTINTSRYSNCSVIIANGLAFTDGTNTYSGTLTADEIADIAGQTLSKEEPFVLPEGTIYVSESGNDENDGLSEENAIATLAHAVEMAKSKENKTATVYMLNGDYTTNAIDIDDDEGVSLSIIGQEKGKVTIHGDGAYIFDVYGDNLVWNFKNLVFDGIESTARTSAALVLYSKNTTHTSPSPKGNFTIDNCIFRNINSKLGAIAIGNDYGNTKVTNCIIENVTGSASSTAILTVNGDGTYTLDNVEIKDCKLDENVASSTTSSCLRSIIYVNTYEADVTISNSKIHNNSGPMMSLIESRSKLTIENTTISDNVVDTSVSGTYGGEYLIWASNDNSDINISQCTITGNTIAKSGKGLFYNQKGSMNVEYSDISGNTVDAFIGSTGNITANNNWWGTNDQPDTKVDKWVIMNVEVDDSDLSQNNKLTLTIDFNHVKTSSGEIEELTDGEIPKESYTVEATAQNGEITPASVVVNKGQVKSQTFTVTETSNVITLTCDGDAVPITIAPPYRGTIYVDKSGSDDNEGSEDFPVATVGKAVELALVDGGSGEIIINEGTYNENGYHVTGDLKVTGVGDVTLDADNQGRLFYMNYGDNANKIELHNLTLTNATGYGAAVYSFANELILDNVTIKENNATGYLIKSNGKLTITGSEISESMSGDVIRQEANGDILIENSVFEDNVATDNYAYGVINIYSGSGKLVIEDSKFINNNTRQGVIKGNNKYNIVVKGTEFTDNTNATSFGGAIYTSGVKLDITDCVFDNNKAYKSGGAIYVGRPTTATVDKCIFIDNTANTMPNGNYYGDAIYNENKLTVNNSAFLGDANNYMIYNKGENNVVAQNCWWGTNENPSSMNGAGTYEDDYGWDEYDCPQVDVSNWVTMDASFTPAFAQAGDEATITATFSNANLPDGINVTFTSSSGNLNTVVSTENAQASTTYTIDANDEAITAISGSATIEMPIVTNIVTQDNFYSFFDDSGNLLDAVTFDELIFQGDFADLVHYITLDRPITITGDYDADTGEHYAVLNDMGFIIAGSEVTIDNLTLVANSNLGNLIDIAGENVVISNNDITYVVSDPANAINVYSGANGVQILNNTINFTSTVDHYTLDDVTNAICVNSGDDPVTGLVINGNEITAVIPALSINFNEIEYNVIGLSAVNGVRINGAEDFEFTNNILDVTTNGLDDYGTLQAMYVASSSGLMDGNDISMIDTFTPYGEVIYLYAVNLVNDNDLDISNNNFNISTDGGTEAFGTACAIESIASEFNVVDNNINIVSKGPNYGIYFPSMMGDPCDAEIRGNFIKVTGLATADNQWSFVSGIEIETGDVEISGNTIYTYNIGEYAEGNYIYGISYAQTIYGDSPEVEITDNTIITEGDYAISFLIVDDAVITGNTLCAHELFGDDAVYIKEGSGNTVENNILGYVIPKTGESTYDIPANVSSFKVYDDGGQGRLYSPGCDGTLTLTAPEGYLLQLSGNITTEKDVDYLTVYDGSSNLADVLINQVSSSVSGTETDIPTVISTDNVMTIYFHSNTSDSNNSESEISEFDGLDLTVTLIYNLNEMAGITAAISDALKGKTVNIAFSRTFEKLSDGEGKASTVCLPFNLDKPSTTDVGTFYTFGGVSSDATGEYVVTMTEETADNLSAGTPYMFRPATTATGAISFQNTAYTVPDDGFTPAGTATDANGWKFKGTYQEKTWTEGQTHLYGFATSDYKKSDNSLLNEVGAFRRFSYGHINPFRCYLLAPGATEARGVSKAGNQLPESLKVILISASGEATAIGTLDTRTGEVTFDGEWYDLNGRRLNGKPTTKGLYINNGKTIVIK